VFVNTDDDEAGSRFRPAFLTGRARSVSPIIDRARPSNQHADAARRPTKRRSPWFRIELLLAGSGLVLVASTLAWLFLVAEVTGGDAVPTAGMLAAAAAVFLVARGATRYSAWLVPLLVAAAAAYVAAANPGTLLARPLGNPLGYSNAVGSFYMLAAAAALLLVARAPYLPLRVVAAVCAVAAALVPWLNSTATASVLVSILPFALFAGSRRGVRVCVSVAGMAVVATLLTTLILGAVYQPGERTGFVDRAVDATLSERRPELWHDALVMVAERPLTGIGPNRFPQESPTAIKDPDTRWPHNEALHFAAEAGIPGFLLLLGLFGWGFARLWWGAGDTGAAVAAAALGAAVVHSNVDYVLHFPAVTLAVAALVGAGSGLPAGRQRRGSGKTDPSERTPGEGKGRFREWDWSFLDDTASDRDQVRFRGVRRSEVVPGGSASTDCRRSIAGDSTPG
jgi:O-antigen ligase